MSGETTLTISIPADNDGYVLLRCEYCGCFFKITPKDAQDDSLLHIYCPSCGLISECYITEDVVELASAMATNIMNDMLYDAFESLESNNRHSAIKFEVGKKPQREEENPIRSGVEAMRVASFACCNRTAKIKPLIIMTGCYCPFCGVKQYELE